MADETYEKFSLTLQLLLGTFPEISDFAWNGNWNHELVGRSAGITNPDALKRRNDALVRSKLEYDLYERCYWKAWTSLKEK